MLLGAALFGKTGVVLSPAIAERGEIVWGFLAEGGEIVWGFLAEGGDIVCKLNFT